MRTVERGPVGYRIHEDLAGEGVVYTGGRAVVTARYVLMDAEELLGPATTGAPDGAPGGTVGARAVFGRLQTPDDPFALSGFVGDRLTLRLDDGRRLDFMAVKSSPPNPYLIQGLGAIQPPGAAGPAAAPAGTG